MAGDEGYNLTRSLRFRSSAVGHLNRTPASAGNQQIWTYSTWVKRGLLGIYGTVLNARNDNSNQAGILFWNTDTLVFTYTTGGVAYDLTTTQVFRDPSACYHIIVAADTTQATAANRIKIYVNGVQVTAVTGSYPPQNSNLFVNSTFGHNIGRNTNNGNYFDGYFAETNLIDGQALTPSSFGSTNSTTGVWQPARYTGTYGTNGFYLPFTDNSALTTSSNVGLGKDFSGNGNYWTTNNISITAGVTYDSMTDVPTLTSSTAANFAVLNPLKSYYAPTNGNLSMSTGSSVTGIDVASISLGTGVKYYFEATATGTAQQIGIFSSNHALTPTGSKRYWYLESGGLYNDGTLLQSVATFTSGDTIAVAWDGTAQTVTFYKNNTQQGTAISVDTSYSYFFGVGAYNGGWNANFGQRPFAYTPPSGFVALNTYNLPDSTIKQGNKVMDATLYTGTLLSNSVTNAAAFKPDLVWLKSRSAATNHKLTDSVRGVTKGLISNTTGAETTDAQGLTAFNSNGFTVGTNTDYNNLAATYVAWQWQAGQGSSSSNTSGTITSTVSVNASAGFSVVTYTGTGANATVGHGLGVAPSFVAVKQRSASGQSWQIYHSFIGQNYSLQFDTSSGAQSYTNIWYNGVTSSVFGVNGALPSINGNGSTYVAYCWSEIAGFSKFGNYTGNGSSDGTFVYTGFRPKYVMIKCSSASATQWALFDTTRNPSNLSNLTLYASLSDAEWTNLDAIDILSNGFKLRNTNSNINTSGATYVFATFAENPFKNSLAR